MNVAQRVTQLVLYALYCWCYLREATVASYKDGLQFKLFDKASSTPTL